MVFHHYDMFDDDFDDVENDLAGFPLSRRDFSGDDDRNNGELCSLANRHLFVHGRRIDGGDKKVFLPANIDVDEPEQHLLTSAFEEIDDDKADEEAIERLDSKKAEDSKKEIEIVEEKKKEEPDFIIVDLNK